VELGLAFGLERLGPLARQLGLSEEALAAAAVVAEEAELRVEDRDVAGAERVERGAAGRARHLALHHHPAGPRLGHQGLAGSVASAAVRARSSRFIASSMSLSATINGGMKRSARGP